MSKLKSFAFMSERKLLMITLIAFILSIFVANVSAEMYWKEFEGHFMPDIDQNQDFDKVEVLTEEDNPSISYQGTWTTIIDPEASGGSRNYADHPASFTFSFTGSSVKWIATKAFNRGISKVWIDGYLMTTVDLYDPQAVNQAELYSNSSLSSGPHIIEIKSTDTKNPASSGLLTSNDAFDVDDIEHEYCAPVAEANSLWWLDKRWEHIEIFGDPINGLDYIGGDINGDGVADILDFVQELAWYKDTNGQRSAEPHIGTTVIDEQIGIHDYLVHYGLDDRLYEHTALDSDFPDPNPGFPPYTGWIDFFQFLEDEVYRSQDVKLDLGFWHILACDGQPGAGTILWQRVGGHAVTVAGVDSQNFLFAVSDPDNDAAEVPPFNGVVRPDPQTHPSYPHDPSVHNNEMFASHDIYTVVHSPSPGGKMGLQNYPPKFNLPPGEPTPAPWPNDFTECIPSMVTLTEIEAAVIVSPKEPDIAVNPTTWDFGNVVVGGSLTKTFTISNTGSGNLVISLIAMTGGNAGMFSVAMGGPNPCPSLTPTIAPGGSCTINAKFSPTSVGTKSTTMRISSNDPDENLLDVLLKGTGPKVVLTSPNFEEILYSGTKWTITWKVYTSKPVAKVLLYLKRKSEGITFIEKIATLKPLEQLDDGNGDEDGICEPKKCSSSAVWCTIDSDCPGGETCTIVSQENCLEVKDEFYTWTVPSFATKQKKCKIKVVLKDASDVTLGKDVSDMFFTIMKAP